VVALEMSPVELPLWRDVFELYMGKIVPILGGFVTGDSGAYEYLPESARAFLTPKAVAGVMREAGLTPLPHRSIMGGGLVLHSGVKPAPLPGGTVAL
jgi:demethylmenaquinone methyltransferase/2-methoxy-6-polyprenyl-1,4-benzoquinol methylase